MKLCDLLKTIKDLNRKLHAFLRAKNGLTTNVANCLSNIIHVLQYNSRSLHKYNSLKD